MKNIMIVDGAMNCAYSIFAVTEQEFCLLFPADRQDIEFIDDVVARMGEVSSLPFLDRIWKRPVDRRTAQGVHGILFFKLDQKRPFYPNKRESDLDLVPKGR